MKRSGWTGAFWSVLATGMLLSASAAAQNPDWPNGQDDDPLLQLPADPSFVKKNDKGEITGGQWNLWSFVPPEWAETKGFRQDEVALGTGIHADRAWQRTKGDRRVIIAVLDSGIRWNNGDLQMKHYISKAELPMAECQPLQPDPPAADTFDVNGDGVFNIADYLHVDPEQQGIWDQKGNQNGIMDPGDLIMNCSDGVDDDGNGFTDDISGWDAMWNDNNPFDDTDYGHGTGEARDSAAAGNDGKGDIGVCPECSVLNVRVGDSFVVDVNDFAVGVIFATDSGAHVVQEALGSINNTPYSIQAIEYAYRNNTVIIASAADELSFHHNLPGTNNHTVYVHAIVHDNQKVSKSTTFLNFNNCTNYGGQLLLSTPGGGCSSEATGITSGHAGLIYSAGVQAGTDPPLSAEELRGILIMSSDDISVPEAATDTTKFPSGPGWDMHFGYGRNNARTSVDMVFDDQIPPEADIAGPSWFEPIEITQRPMVDITGRVGGRVDGLPARYDNYAWELEYAVGVDPKGGWTPIASGTEAVGGGPEPATLATWDAAKAAEAFDYSAPLADAHQYSITLRLRVSTEHGGATLKNEFRKTVHLFQDPTLLPGFPKQMGTSLESSAKVLDIDGDGKEEMVFASTDGWIHAMKADGTEAPGFPTELGMRKEANPDGHNILGICAFKPEDDKGDCKTQGRVNPDVARQSVMSSIGVGALGGDKSDLSIVTLTFDGFAFVHDSAGQLREGWPQRTNPEHSAVTSKTMTLDEGFFAAPVLYDLDGDGDLEIIAAAMDQYIYVWHHDGSPMQGWPLLIADPLETQRARIIATPAVGDVDGDGSPDIVAGTNEAYGAGGVEQEARGYLLAATGSPDKTDIKPALAPGWPVTTFGLIVNTLPLIGRGCPTNPAIADLDGDGKQEVALDALAFFPQIWKSDGSAWEPQMDNGTFGSKTNSEDAPSYTLMNNAAFAKLDPGDTIDIIKGTAGFDFALTFAEGGKRAIFDHHLSAWDTNTGNYIEGFPRVMDDWQFFTNPTVVDLDGDGLPEVLNGSGGYLLHAFNYLGEEPEGFPKMLGGWIIMSPSFGDLTGDGKFEVVDATRAGWLFAWSTQGPTWGRIEWQSYSHDFHNTNNYDEPVAAYNDYPEAPPEGTDGSDGTDASDGATTGDPGAGGDEDDGGSCQAGSSSAPASGWLLLLGVLGVMAMRRRRVTG